MNKIIMSWLAVDNDFKNNGSKVNEMGPTVNFHAHHYSHDEHILLYTPDYEDKAIQLLNYLKTNFSASRIVIKPVVISEVHKNLQIIKNKVETILLENAEKHIDILLSTGSGIMKIAWYICHTTLNLNTHILQIMKPSDSKDPLQPDLIELNFEKSQVPVSAIIREQNLNKIQSLSNILILDSTKEQFDRAYKIAQTDNVSTLILGNTGSGKEIIARYMHQNSPRKNKTFISVNCAALSDQLLESRLFGYKKGSFTGAYTDYKGVFEQAKNGTVFLDEIGDISPYMQQALLRFLQEKEIQPIGGKTKKIDTRIIAATNKNIQELINEKKFRADLFYRLGITIELPDFKNYLQKDKLQWIDSLLKQKQKEFKRKQKLILSDELMNFLVAFNFPGNIRELINIIDNLYIFQTKKAHITDLPKYINQIQSEYSLNIHDVEKQHIKKVFKLFKGNKTKTHKALGMSLNTLKTKLLKYEIKID